MDALDFVSRITRAGFKLAVRDDRLLVSPVEKLTDTQRAFIRQHRPEILAALTGKPPAPAVEPAPPAYHPGPADLATVADWLRQVGEDEHGVAVYIARCQTDPETLADFLARANQAKKAQHHPAPNRATTGTVGGAGIHCRDCARAEPTQHPALIVCGAGRRAPGACGYWWALDRRDCASFKAITNTNTEDKP